MTKKLTITKDIEYDYITFNGSNYKEVCHFVAKYHIYGNSTIDESFHIRPADIPHFDTENELLEWWESTGEIQEITQGCHTRRRNTHNYNNMPLWRKGEMIMIECRCGHDGYVEREWMQIGDTIIWSDGMHAFIKNTTDPDEIEEYVKDIDMFSKI